MPPIGDVPLLESYGLTKATGTMGMDGPGQDVQGWFSWRFHSAVI